MATFQVMSWRGIPAQIRVSDDSGVVVSRQLPPAFQQEIDRVAMREGLIDSDEYLEGWEWSDPMERDGAADAVAAALVDELSAEWHAHRGPASGER